MHQIKAIERKIKQIEEVLELLPKPRFNPKVDHKDIESQYIWGANRDLQHAQGYLKNSLILLKEANKVAKLTRNK